MLPFPRWRRAATAAAAALVIGAAPAGAANPPLNSPIDAPLFYQLLIGELELRAGQAGNAFQVILDAARRTRDEQLFRRALDIALQARAGDQALVATRAWRIALPESLDAIRMQLQTLVGTNRLGDTVEPLRTLIAQTPAAERPGLVAALPRFMQRASDRKQAATIIEQVLEPMRRQPALAVAAQVAIGRAWLAAGDGDRALALAEAAQQADAKAPGPALLALELMPSRPQAERLVVDHLKQPGAEPAIRLAYVGALTTAQRLLDAAAQLAIVTRERPDLAPPFLTLGAVQLELRHPREAEAALERYLQLAQVAPTAASQAPAAAAAGAAAATSSGESAGDEEDDEAKPDRAIVRAWMMLSQAAEMRKDLPAAEAWLARIEPAQRTIAVEQRRATLLARQGQIEAARAMLRGFPERAVGDARTKLVAEAQLLRDVKRLPESFAVLADAAQRFPNDVDLLYEQAMVAEKIDRLPDMERLLRRVIELRPDHAHAHNALGYSLADRGQRLTEARTLIVRALELMPGDPFITDSLAWVEFRLGNREEALRLFRRAYAARPDTEIGAHLGEVLWTLGQRDEARRIWREAAGRDADNEVLRETLQRLRVEP